MMRSRKGKKMVRKYVIVTGRVQGVGFRYHAVNLAMEYNVTGWVRNMYNGGVEMEVQGLEANVEQFIRNLDAGTHWIRIDHTSVADSYVLPDETTFRIRY
jgi:acylphosphatase